MTGTKRLYYEDVYQKEFDAQVLICEKVQKGYRILLDQSAFYPEGGGQPCDLGELDEITVLDVQEQEGELWHYTGEPLQVGRRVHGRINWERRFDLMQQHSGEHIVSGLIHAAYGYNNVGFHMGSDTITVDVSGPLSPEQLSEIEQLANTKLWENGPVEITYPSEEELKAIPYRSKKELTGQVRIVTFPGIDICACCGTHVTRTGEIGMIKLLSVEKFHDGVRIEMICGGRALRYLNQVDAQNRGVSVLLSARPDRTAEAASRLLEENVRLKGSLLHMEETLRHAEAEAHKDEGNVLLFKGEMEADSLRKLTDAVQQTCGGRCAVFSENPDGSYKYAIGEPGGDLRALTKELNAALNGRGGGKPFFVQGSVRADEAAIRKFFEEK
jgi:alanyl-tRNA synthetase